MRRLKQSWRGFVFVGLASILLTSSVQADQKADPTGTWKWERTFGGNTVEFTLRLQLKGEKITGTYASRRGETKIENAKLEGDQLSFEVNRERNDRSFQIKFQGKVSEDALKGNGSFSFDGGSREFDWEAQRSVEMDDVLGTWNLRIETQNGNVREPSLTLRKDGDKLKGAYVGRSGERELKNLTLKDNRLTFEIGGERDGNTWKVKYKGMPRGNSINGTIDYDFNGNTGTIDFAGKRAAEKKKDKNSE